MSSNLKFSIIVFPGSNCDRDLKIAIEKNFNLKPNLVWHQEAHIKKSDIIFIPGGFSYGDYLRAGVLASKSPAVKEVIRLSKKGSVILGICNGFQILTECKLLPGTLIKNKIPKFLCKDVHLKINKSINFLKKSKINNIIKLPIAHAQGNYYANKKDLNEIIKNNQIFLQYCSTTGKISNEINPNGSIKNIAGITNKSSNVIGMMPHPERAIGDDNKSGSKLLKIISNIL